MSPSSVRGAVAKIPVDPLIMTAGLGLAVPFTVAWLSHGGSIDVRAVAAVLLVVAMTRLSLVLPNRSGDIVIGFEPCVLVYLLLTGPALEAFAIWSISAVAVMLTDRESWHARMFNAGDTILGGALFVLAFSVVGASPADQAVQLVAVLIGCALYFVFDLLLTAGAIAVEEGCSIRTVLEWRSLPLGFACLISVSSLGYLAALLHEDQPTWTLLLLLVPMGTILVAVRTVSDNRLAQRRLVGLLEAATHAPDWSDEEQIEHALLVQAERTLWQTTASLRDQPAQGNELGVPLYVDGRPTRYLVVRPQPSARPFTSQDRAALEALTAVGASAFQRRRLTDEMVYLARHDALTGLHNRKVFVERLTEALESRPKGGWVAVLYCDLDGFKEVNDLLGHQAGDELLVCVAARVMRCLREQDTGARLGGDEFGIVLGDLTDPSQADAVAQRLLGTLEEPFEVADQSIRVRVSIGIAFADADITTADELVDAADAAMYVAKSHGKACVEHYDSSMRARQPDGSDRSFPLTRSGPQVASQR